MIEDLNASQVEGVFDQDGFKLYIGTSLGDLTVLDFNPKIPPCANFCKRWGAFLLGNRQDDCMGQLLKAAMKSGHFLTTVFYNFYCTFIPNLG